GQPAWARAWRALRRRAVRAARQLDDALYARLPRRRRVLFEARTPVNFVCLKPIHDRLVADPRIECWYTATEGDVPARELYARFGITARVVPQARAEWLKVDLYLNSDFARMAWLRRRAIHVHFFHGVAGKYDLDGTRSPVRDMSHFDHLARFDRIAFINEDRLRKWREVGLLAPDDPRPVLIGYPKVDGLVTGRWPRAATLARLGLDPARPVLLYAPTWSAASSLHLFGEAIVRALRATGHQVIVKLHDRAYDRRERYSAGVDWAARLAPLAADPGVRLVTDPDATPLLAAADLLVSDHSSVAFEFLLVDRPLVIFDLPGLLAAARVHPDQARWLREAALTVATPAELPDAVGWALAHPEARSQARRALAARLFYRPGSATDRAVALCYELLGLPQAGEAADGA
ncbi:MAG TPA: CDP-glycerol glycerophosphotransferase family protein, partial [Thermodesulfobacteriota bacterium]|nr:CDP-glycerol glycerophosphotransferase family protein [Thermodesulfobacteriota bacterium]